MANDRRLVASSFINAAKLAVTVRSSTNCCLLSSIVSKNIRAYTHILICVLSRGCCIQQFLIMIALLNVPTDLPQTVEHSSYTLSLSIQYVYALTVYIVQDKLSWMYVNCQLVTYFVSYVLTNVNCPLTAKYAFVQYNVVCCQLIENNLIR